MLILKVLHLLSENLRHHLHIEHLNGLYESHLVLQWHILVCPHFTDLLVASVYLLGMGV